jgi:hypothetical protein
MQGLLFSEIISFSKDKKLHILRERKSKLDTIGAKE